MSLSLSQILIAIEELQLGAELGYQLEAELGAELGSRLGSELGPCNFLSISSLSQILIAVI